jgi:hypothetical protein
MLTGLIADLTMGNVILRQVARGKEVDFPDL